MAKKFLLSSGKLTSKEEEYILDIFRINLTILPNDIPGTTNLGFDFSLGSITKDKLEDVVYSKVTLLVKKVQDQFPRASISITSLVLNSEDSCSLVLEINGSLSDTFDINFYN